MSTRTAGRPKTAVSCSVEMSQRIRDRLWVLRWQYRRLVEQVPMPYKTFSNFLQGQQGISRERFDRVMELLGLCE
jgi:hypothetical protein